MGLALDTAGQSPDLASLAPLLNVPGLRFYALNAETAAQIGHGPFAGWIADLSMAETDPAESSAVLSQLDLVIGGANAAALNAAAFEVSSLGVAAGWQSRRFRSPTSWYSIRTMPMIGRR